MGSGTGDRETFAFSCVPFYCLELIIMYLFYNKRGEECPIAILRCLVFIEVNHVHFPQTLSKTPKGPGVSGIWEVSLRVNCSMEIRKRGQDLCLGGLGQT
jgi:hypothetical protein